ncbi:tagaturonate epimerase family protein, partial [bacterium]|nr:tagaturonate epimerase family protein [bacterium]
MQPAEKNLAAALKAAAASGAESLAAVPGVYAASVKHAGGALFAAVRLDGCKRLAVVGGGPAAARFEGESVEGVKLCPQNAANSAALRETFPWTAPVTIGRRASFGVGDRLGVATPGHLRAFARYDIFPVLAQQSMRELGRTERKPQDVIDDAGWGAFQAGWTDTFAADADHIKQVHEVLDCWRKGYTMFTIDASEHIELAAVRLSDEEALERFAALPEYEDFKSRFSSKEWNFKGEGLSLSISFTPAQLARCALVYHKAVAHMALIYRELSAAAGNPLESFDFEV